MDMFKSFDGMELAYFDSRGGGEPLMLLHDFTTSSLVDWEETGVCSALIKNGLRVVMLDARGHGKSDKPHASYYYWNRAMAQDVNALAEHLGLEEYSLMGHTMGAKVAVEAALMYSGIRGLVMVGFSVYDDNWRYDEAERMARVKSMLSKKACTGDKYRKSAELHKGDRKAFAARLQGAILPEFTRSELKRIRIPVLVVNGSQDEYSAPDAAGCFPTAEGITLEGSSRSVLMNSLLPQVAAEFLERADRLV